MDDHDQPVVKGETEPTTQVVDFAASNEVAQPGNVPASPFSPGPQDEATQPLPNDPPVILEAPEIEKEGGRHSDDRVAPDELPPNEKGDEVKGAPPTVGSEGQAEKGKAPSNPVDPLAPALLSVPTDASVPGKSTPTAPVSRKSFFERVIPAEIRQWPSKATGKGTLVSGETSGQSAGKKTDDQQKGDEKKDDEKKEPETHEKGLDGTNQKEAEKAPEIDPWETCKLEIIETTELKYPTVDILAIHDLDENPTTAWIFIPQRPTQKISKISKDNDLESRRSSIERIRQQPQTQPTLIDKAKKRRGSTIDDTAPGFKDGKITQEGRNQKVAEWAGAGIDFPATTDPEDLAPPTSSLSPAGPSNVPPQQTELQKGETSTPGPSGKGPEIKAFSSGKDEKGYDGTEVAEPKRTKSSKEKRKKGKRVTPNPVPPTDPVPPVPPLPGTTPPKPAQLDPGNDDGKEIKENDKGRASERELRSGRQSTEIEGSERRRAVNLLRDANMIPGAFPGARILSYTYPNVSATTAVEYLDKVAQKLLESLVKARVDQHYNTVPIIFVGYGFGGLVLQKVLLVLADAAHILEKSVVSAQILNMAAGLVVLDTPFPTLEQTDEDEKAPFPLVPNARQEHILRRLKENGNKLHIGTLWERFDTERQSHQLPIVWLYTSVTKDSTSSAKIQPKRPLPALALRGIFCMAMVPENRRGLCRFSSPKDPIYLRIVSQMQRFLLFKASGRKELEILLWNLITVLEVQVDVEDEHGRSALHHAASSPNGAAVTVLIKKGDAKVLRKDNAGQTPLHAVIRRAVELKPTDEEGQKPFKDVIIRLMESSPDINQADNDNKVAWDYAKKITWIEELRNNRDMFSGPSTSDEAEPVEPLNVPAKDTPQRKACQNILGVLTEFYLITKGQRTQEKLNYERPNIFDMIYEEGPTKILDRSRPRLTMEILQCRWMHLPANNEQWVQDLFIKLKIKDSSIVGQRHEGTTPYSRYMIAQATKYKQVYEQHDVDTTPLDDGKISRYSHSTEISGNTTAAESAIGHSIGTSDGEILRTNAEGSRDMPQAEGSASNAFSDPVAKKLTMVDKDAIALFMPILAYETSKLRKKMTKAIRKVLEEGEIEEESNDSLLLQGYLDDENPKLLHCRRTLDQFSYYMLDTTESRDRDQVIYHWGRKKLAEARESAGDAPILMVDQLWLWVLHDGTLITSFPNSWEKNKSYSLKKSLDKEIEKNKQRDLIRSVDHLVHLIIKLSVDFFRREGPSKIKFQEAFQSSINNIAEREAEQFKRFKDLTKKLNDETLTEGQRTKKIKKLFQLHTETRLLVQIKDIQDELNIVNSVLGQQKEILEKLRQLCSTNESTEEDSQSPEKSKQKPVREIDLAADKPIDQPDSRDKPKHKGILRHDDAKEELRLQENKERKQVRFPDEEFKEAEKDHPVLRNRSLVEENLGIVKGNIRIVEDMANYAAQVQTSINNLLDLKQRQANAWEARFSREGSQQSQRQGNIMLVFTLVTIVFLPLSFMSSFFAISINDFPKDSKSGNTSWPLHTLALLLFGVSTLVFIPLIIIALYVNQITSSFRAFFLGKKAKTDDNDDIDENIEEDESDQDDDDSNKADNSDEIEWDGFSVHSIYAPIFGRWKFHTHIPILRKLWERRAYLNTDSDDGYLFDEDRDVDYPLHHFLSKISLRKLVPTPLLGWWILRKFRNESDEEDDSNLDWRRDFGPPRIVIEERYRRRDNIGSRRRFRRRLSSDDDDVVVIEEDSNDFRTRAGMIFGPVQRIFRRRGRGEAESETASYETESSERESRQPRESGSGSGSERADRQTGVSGRLGAAFPEPFRRLFVRRRRSHDVESILVDD